MIDAIPAEWRKKVTRCRIPVEIIDNNENPHIKINQLHKDITQVKARDIYGKLLKNNETRPNCIDAWNTRLRTELTIKDWTYIFTLPKNTVSDTKVIETQLKFYIGVMLLTALYVNGIKTSVRTAKFVNKSLISCTIL